VVHPRENPGYAYVDMGVPHFNALGAIPANIRINFTSSETRMIALPDAEDRTIVCSFVWTKHRNVTDGRMDRQTDGQNPSSYYSRLHCEQCGRTVTMK